MQRGVAATVLAILIACALFARPVFAQPTADAARARTLFYDARKLMTDGRYAEACTLFEESEQLDPGMGTEFNLADCYEHIGRFATALALFEKVIAQSHDAARDRHEALARKRADAIAPRVPTLVVQVPDEARVAGLAITRDGDPFVVGLWSTTTRIDPGHHVLVARAPDRVTWEKTIDVTEGEHATVRVPTLDPIAPPIAPTMPAPVATTAPTPQPPPPPPPLIVENGRTQRTIGLVAGGVGIVGLAIGGVLGVMSLVARDDARQWCNTTTNGCSSTLGTDARESAVARGNASTGFFIAGGALVGAGAVLWLTAPRATVVRVGVVGSPNGGASLSARGEF